MTISHDKIAPLVALLDMPQRVVITIHYNPDGDSLGSSLALYHLLTAKGHSVEILAPNTPPPFYGWLPSFGIVRDFLAETAVCVDLIENATMLFSMDYNELSRAGKMEEHLRNAKVPLVLIDHHPDPEDCTPFLFSDTKVSSASELTYQFIRAMYPNDVLSTKVAECIFTGIMTDTGMFQHNSSRPETFRIVADLLECGIDKDKIKGKVFDTSTTDRLRLTGFCLSEKMVVMPELHAGYIALSMAELARFNFQKGDQEGLVNYPLKVDGLCFSALVVESEELIKISMRSKGNFDVNKLMRKHFEGGGHRNAAGGRSYDTLENTVNKLEDVLAMYKAELALTHKDTTEC